MSEQTGDVLAIDATLGLARPGRARADYVVLDEAMPPDPRRSRALDARRQRGTGPTAQRLDGRRPTS